MKSKSKITSGETKIMLGEREFVLVPSLRATTQISRQYEGLQKARQLLVAENFDAVVFILRLGIRMEESEKKNLPDMVYENGLTAELLIAMINYVAILGNGGKPLDEDEEKDEKNEDFDSGNE